MASGSRLLNEQACPVGGLQPDSDAKGELARNKSPASGRQGVKRARAPGIPGLGNTDTHADEMWWLLEADEASNLADHPPGRQTVPSKDGSSPSTEGTCPVDDLGGLEWKLERIQRELEQLPVQSLYPHLVREGLAMLRRWQTVFSPTVFARITKHHRQQSRFAKELNEAAPVLEWTRHVVAQMKTKVTIVDICSGFGFLSMFLAELISHEHIHKIVLVDKKWPMRNQAVPGTCTRRHSSASWRESHARGTDGSPTSSALTCGSCPCLAGPTQISWEHIYTKGAWDVHMETRKHDIKSPASWRQLEEYVFAKAQGKCTRNNVGEPFSPVSKQPYGRLPVLGHGTGPVIMLGIHLCGTLSIKAVAGFNQHDAISHLALKPCCLPGKQLLRHTKHCPWTLGTHTFTAEHVYYGLNGTESTHGRDRLGRWSEHLLKGVDVAEPTSGGDTQTVTAQRSGRKWIKLIEVQRQHFQNYFLFAHR